MQNTIKICQSKDLGRSGKENTKSRTTLGDLWMTLGSLELRSRCKHVYFQVLWFVTLFQTKVSRWFRQWFFRSPRYKATNKNRC